MKLFFVIASVMLTLSLSAQKNGKQAYEASCKACHGDNGAGVKDPKLSGPNLTILKDKFAKEQFKLITSGKRKGPGVENMMKVLKESKLSDKELQSALDYALKLKEAPSFHTGGGEPKKGKAKYSTICLHCHGQNAKGYSNPALPAPRLAGQSDTYIFNQIKGYKAGHRDGDSPASQQMKAMSMTLATDKDIMDVAAYIRTLDTFKRGDIGNLTYKVYQGDWSKLPDFSKLKAVKAGTLAAGLIDIKVSEMTEKFAMVFEGDLNVPKDGNYTFSLASDDGSNMYINGKKVIDHDGIHPAKAKTKTVKLSAGTAKLKVTYFEKGGQEELSVAWKGKKDKKYKPLSPGAKGGKSKPGATPIPIEPNKVAGEALLFRNFIKGATSRSIAVGYPEGTHIVFDATNLNLAMMWKGNYLDAGAMWNGRGTGHMEAQGDAIAIGTQPQVGILANEESQWPELSRKSNEVRKSDLRFRGYTLDKKRYPTFMYSLKDIRFEDFFKPIDANGTGIERTVTAKAGSAVSGLWFRVASDNITQSGSVFTIGGKYTVKADGAKIRPYGKIKELIIPFSFSNGAATIKIQYLFAEGGE
jgi:cytochrome c553